MCYNIIFFCANSLCQIGKKKKTRRKGQGYSIQGLHFQLTEKKFLSERRILYLKELEMDSGR